jgi:hypothetical protein
MMMHADRHFGKIAMNVRVKREAASYRVSAACAAAMAFGNATASDGNTSM